MQVLAGALIAVPLFLVASATATRAVDAPIVLPTQNGPICITPIYHASLQIDYRGKTIQVDPFSQGNYTNARKADIPSQFKNALQGSGVRVILRDWYRK